MKQNIVLASTYQKGSEYCMEKGFARKDVYLVLPYDNCNHLFTEISAIAVDDRNFTVHYAFGSECIKCAILSRLSELLNKWI